MKWHCESFDAGWLIIVESNGVKFARHITSDHFKVEHEPEWAFWSAVRSLARAVDNLGKVHG